MLHTTVRLTVKLQQATSILKYLGMISTTLATRVFSFEHFKMRALIGRNVAVLFVTLIGLVILGKATVETGDSHQNPEPFLDILDIPPELRSLPGTPNIYDLLSILSMEQSANNRISFSADKPRHNPDLPPERSAAWTGHSSEFRTEPAISVLKRDQSPPLRACPVQHEWVNIQTATDIYNTEVEVSQLQWFWKTTCLQANQSCYGFNRSEENSSTTECRETNSWVMAWAREIGLGDTDYSWRHIAVPACCSCAIIEGEV